MKKLSLGKSNSANLKWYLLGILGYVALAAVFLYFVILPEFQKYDKLIAGQISMEGTYVDLVDLNITSAIDKVKHQIENLKRLRNQFEDRLLDDNKFNALMPVIDNLSKKSNLTVATLDPVKSVEEVKPKYIKRSITASLIGKYKNFITFLGKLEANPEWLLIEKLRIIPTKESAIYRYNLIISVLMEAPEDEK